MDIQAQAAWKGSHSAMANRAADGHSPSAADGQSPHRLGVGPRGRSQTGGAAALVAAAVSHVDQAAGSLAALPHHMPDLEKHAKLLLNELATLQAYL